MRRREFITLLSGVAAAWPFAARAQQPTKQHRVGVITLGDVVAKSFEAELREGLRQSGLIEGQNLQYESRAADGNISLLPKIAAELVALKIDVIVALYTPCALAAQRATRDIPIVVVAGDPVGLGLVASLARPGGNITGMSLIGAELHGKCVELFRDLIPGIRRVAVLGNGPDPIVKPMLEQIRLAGKNTGIEIAPEILVGPSDEIDLAFAAMKKNGAEAVVAQASLAPSRVVEGALKYHLPMAAVSKSFADAGALMTYGVDGPVAFRRSAFFVIKILQGVKPEDLPVEQPTKFELVINLRTAKSLGLAIPPSFLQRADEVIE